MAALAAKLDAKVTVAHPAAGRGPVSARSPISLMTLGAAQGAGIVIEAVGPGAAEAVERIAALVLSGFGEPAP
ncbi:MAG: HPr family phosphocarrier protein [Bifidobacteriaceae bacterium]|nr:HPr family phosphocarrier protein [Bifidobacteriaceae bacterium]